MRDEARGGGWIVAAWVVILVALVVLGVCATGCRERPGDDWREPGPGRTMGLPPDWLDHDCPIVICDEGGRRLHSEQLLGTCPQKENRMCAECEVRGP